MHSCFQWKSSQTWICAFLNDPVWYIGTKCLIYLTSPIVKHDLTSNFFTFSNWKAFWDRKKNIVLCLQWLQSHRSASKVQLSRNKQWQEIRKPGGKGWMMKVWESEWRMVDDEMRWDGGLGGSCRWQLDKGVLIIFGKRTRSYWFGAMANELQFVKRCFNPQRCKWCLLFVSLAEFVTTCIVYEQVFRLRVDFVV